MQEEGFGLGLIGSGLSGLINLGRAGTQIVRGTPRMAMQAFRSLPTPVQQTIRTTLEYGQPVHQVASETAQGRDPRRVLAEVISGEVVGRKLRGVTSNPVGKFVMDPVGNFLGSGTSWLGTELMLRQGQQPSVAPVAQPSSGVPEWRRQLEQGL